MDIFQHFNIFVDWLVSGKGGLALPVSFGLLVLVLVPFLSRLSGPLGLIDLPDERKRHEVAVPLVGGLAIYVAILLATLIIDLPEKLFWLLFSASVLVVVGALDDVFNLNFRIRIVAQLMATVLMIFTTDLWIRSVDTGISFLDHGISHVGLILTLIAVIGLTNAFNMVDGIDGLAAGQFLLGLGSLCVSVMLNSGEIPHLEWLVILASVIFVFWLINLSLTPLSRVFLGDAGSMLLGFIMSWILIYFSQAPVSALAPTTALWCVTIPVLDTLIVIIRRLRWGASPFKADRNHLHYILMDLGINKYKTLFLIMLLSVLVNGLGIFINYVISPLASLLTYFILMVFLGYLLLNKKFQKQLAIVLKSRLGD